jgi:hypothetical protein
MNVETFKGVGQLSGFVKTVENQGLAAIGARGSASRFGALQLGFEPGHERVEGLRDGCGQRRRGRCRIGARGRRAGLELAARDSYPVAPVEFPGSE